LRNIGSKIYTPDAINTPDRFIPIVIDSYLLTSIIVVESRMALHYNLSVSITLDYYWILSMVSVFRWSSAWIRWRPVLWWTRGSF